MLEMNTDNKIHNIIFQLKKEVEKSEHVSTIIVSKNWYSSAIPAVSIGLNEVKCLISEVHLILSK